MQKLLFALICLLGSPSLLAACQAERLRLLVLGSGGPELTDRRASTAYLLSLDGAARILVDAGPGSALNFESSKAGLNDLRFVLFSHLHVDHSADFAAFLKAFYFSGRSNDLAVYGPEGNHLMPGTREFIRGLAGSRGIYRYLAEYVEDDLPGRFKIRPKELTIGDRRVMKVFQDDSLSLSATPVHHGPIPTLAWRVDTAGCSVTFSGDMNNQYDTLAGLAQGSDILVAHHAIPEDMGGAARRLHMPPSEIGKVAAQAGVKKLVLSHRMRRTLGHEQRSLEEIRKNFQGPVYFAEDMDIFSPELSR